MKKKFKQIVLVLLVIIAAGCSDEITEIEQTDQVKLQEGTTLKSTPTEYAVKNFYQTKDSNLNEVTFTGKSSRELNRFIQINKTDGAIIKITKGTYFWSNIKMESNVHLLIEAETIIKPESNSTSKIFNLGANGSSNGRIENVSIVGLGGKFIVDISSSAFTNKNIAVAKIGRVNNFMLNRMTIKDRRSSVASIILAYIGGSSETKPWASNGVIINVNQTNAHTGYGLVQCYAGDNILFKNITCEGGVTLRLETDDRTMKDEIKNGEKQGGVKNIYAYNVRCINGLTALMFSPHFTQNGKVTIDKVVAVGCAFAVRIEHGFVELFDVNKKYSTSDKNNGPKFKNYIESQFNLPSGVKATSGSAYKRNNGKQWAVRLSGNGINAARNTYVKNQLGVLKAGQFITSTINHVTANYKNNKSAKIKQAYLQYIPSSDWKYIKNPTTSLGMFNGFEYHCPSVALSTDNTNGTTNDGNYIINLKNQNFNGFPSTYIQNIKYNTPPKSNNKPSDIKEYVASF